MLPLAVSSAIAAHALLTRPASSAAALPHCRRRAAAPRCSERQEWLSTRVREALLDDAERLFTVWTEGEPRPLKVNLDLLANRARVLLRRGDESGAMETWQRCQELDPGDGRAWLAMAKYQARIGAYDEAERTLRMGLKWEPESAFLLQTYGWLQEKRGAPDEALTLYSSAVRGNPRHAASWVACGLLLERRRKKEAAWRCLQTARLVAPDSYYVHQVVGQAHVRRGELSLAREAFRRSLVLNKRNAATMHAWGVLEWRCGHTDAARALFDKALKASPSNRYVLQSWACLEARAGAGKEAKSLFARAAKRGASDGATWQARALAAKAEGRTVRARELFEKGVVEAPTHAPLFHAWGVLEMEQGNLSSARDILQRGVWAVRGKHEAAVPLWTAWGLLEERSGDLPGARECMRSALKADRFAVAARGVWAGMERRAANLPTARQLYEDALKIDPQNEESAQLRRPSPPLHSPSTHTPLSLRSPLHSPSTLPPLSLRSPSHPPPPSPLQSGQPTKTWSVPPERARRPISSTLAPSSRPPPPPPSAVASSKRLGIGKMCRYLTRRSPRPPSPRRPGRR